MSYATEPPCAEDGDIYWLYNVKYYPKPVMFEYNPITGWSVLQLYVPSHADNTYHPNKAKHTILSKVIVPDTPVEPLRPKDNITGWYLLYNDTVAGIIPSTWYYDSSKDIWMDAKYDTIDTPTRLRELGYTLYTP